ncbi:hypothetical protein B005_4926 [Nocardiopsis alba ATCC BAA-2165]|uniref:Uncharacterized protein n=1 Tax=Nocardiopsis alba (strain ATCC BAA-2165 / BE74) TaxID=1205910 RepID=J7KYT8_NOCAA|nr:hypothetical protein B005_4926 [Nocardiopsis alba ATCC BAA-2165]
MRGEQPGDAEAVWNIRGSSPRARGAACLRGLPRSPGGVIPACAGSREALLEAPAVWEGHPRVRGEQNRGQRQTVHPKGSSPRARGAGARADR